MSGREGGKKKPLKAPKKDGKVRRYHGVFGSFVILTRDFYIF
jgi:Translation machinery associated TMA7